MAALENGIVQYFHDTVLEAKNWSAADGADEQSHFTTLSLDRLAEADEIYDITLAQHEGVGKNRKKVQIDAYGFDEVDNSFIFVVSDYLEGEEIGTITKTEVDTYLDSVMNFCEVALDDSLLRLLEKSSASAEAAYDFKSKFLSVNKVRIYLVSTRRQSTRIKSLPMREIQGKKVESTIWDISRFYDLYISKMGREEIEIDLTAWGGAGTPALKSSSNRATGFNTYLLVLPGRVLAEIYEQHGARLLESNVRSFLSLKGKVNKGIKATILNEPKNFLAFNNGVSSTASSVETIQTNQGLIITKIRGLQIVNGGQTTASLGSYLRTEKEKIGNLDHVDVQVKLIVVDNDESESLVPNIARYSNTQNTVSEADFFANSPFHIRMEEISRKLTANPRPGEAVYTRWFYERARGSYLNEKNRQKTPALVTKFENENPNSQKITKTDLAKYSNLLDCKPHLVSRGAQKNFLEFAKGIAEKYASEETKALFTETYYKKIALVALLRQLSYKAIKNADWNEAGYLANIVDYTVSRFFQELSQRNMDLNWEQVWRSQNYEDSLISDIEQNAQVIRKVLTSTSSNVTEWAKQDACWKAVKEEPFVLSRETLDLLQATSSQRKREERAETKATGNLMNEVEMHIELSKYDKTQLSALKISKRITVTPVESGIIDAFIAGRSLSKAQMQRLFSLIEKAKNEGEIS